MARNQIDRSAQRSGQRGEYPMRQRGRVRGLHAAEVVRVENLPVHEYVYFTGPNAAYEVGALD